MNYIDNVYVINMERSKDRLINMERQIPIIGKKFIRVEGVDGKKLSKMEIARYTDAFCNTFCTYSMIGCFLSHMKCWSKVVENNDKYAMIMEDDAELVKSFQSDIKNVLDELMQKDPNWDFLYTGYLGGSNDFISYFHKLTLTKINKKSNDWAGGKFSFIPETPIGFHCYIITNDCAKKMLKVLYKVTYHVDVEFLRNNKYFKIYASRKNLAYQFTNSSNSTQTENFPIVLNYLLKDVKCNKGISYNYYLSVPIVSIGKFNMNAYLVLFILFAIVVPYPYNVFLFLYFIPELYYYDTNYSYIIFWTSCVSLAILLKFFINGK